MSFRPLLARLTTNQVHGALPLSGKAKSFLKKISKLVMQNVKDGYVVCELLFLVLLLRITIFRSMSFEALQQS